MFSFQKAKRISFVHAADNQLVNLPKDLKHLPSLENLLLYNNNLKSLEGTLQKSRKLSNMNLSFNKIEIVSIPT